VQAAEAPRVVEAQALAGIEHEVVVVVQQPRRTGRHDAQAAGHAEVRDQRAALELDQQVLGPAVHVEHALPGDLPRELGLDGPAQARLAQVERADRAADQRRADAAPRRFDFGKFRHGCGGSKRKNPPVAGSFLLQSDANARLT
jgi:hypothetical protein